MRLPGSVHRCLSISKHAGGARLSPGSFGAAGGTGTFVWISPARDLSGALLTNQGLSGSLDALGWSRMLDRTGVVGLLDGMIGAVVDAC